MAYFPRFTADEFRALTSHYQIDLGGKRMMYTYIRKNACSTFKAAINRNTHLRYRLRSLVGLERFPHNHIGGNMRYAALGQPTSADGFDETIFVYRDPAARLISTYLNKFVAVDGAEDIRVNYTRITGQDFDQARFVDFLDYVSSASFQDLDCHLWPQKSHLRPLPYSRAIRMENLAQTMSTVLGPDLGQQYFGRRHNNSSQVSDGGTADDNLAETPAQILRDRVAAGQKIASRALRIDPLTTVAATRYAADYAMIQEVETEVLAA